MLVEAQCCAILQSVGFTPTSGIPVLVVDTDGKTVGGGGLDQAGKPTTGNNNGQNAEFVPMQMCTCSAGVTNATYGGSGKIRLRGGNNSGLLALPCLLSMGASMLEHVSALHTKPN